MRIPALWPEISEDARTLDRYNLQFLRQLIRKTRDFCNTTWLGQPIQRNILDLWIIQETIAHVKPALLVETGTCAGGSALFYAHLFDLLGQGEVVTVDVQKKHALSHPRIEFLLGSSVGPEILVATWARVKAVTGPVLVILDSDHSAKHVLQEMEACGSMVTPGSYMLVQDGHIDTLDVYPQLRPGPVPAIVQYLKQHPEFVLDKAKCEKFLITHHPAGWLRKVRQTDEGRPQ